MKKKKQIRCFNVKCDVCGKNTGMKFTAKAHKLFASFNGQCKEHEKPILNFNIK